MNMFLSRCVRKSRRPQSLVVVVALATLGLLLAQHLSAPYTALAESRAAEAQPAGIQASPPGQRWAAPAKVAVMMKLHAAINDGDLEAATAFFADNAVFVGASRNPGAACSQTAPCTDIGGVRRQLQTSVIGTHSCFAIT